MPQIQQRIVSIINLFPSDLHIFVRPEISSLADLAGKKVNFNTQGTAAAYSGTLIFSRLGVSVDKMFIPHPVALEQLRRGEIAAVVFITTKPVDPFVKGKWDDGFKFLPVEFGPKFSDYYVASSLEFADYPNLIAKGERVATIAVPTVLASYNWRPETPRYRRVERFVEEFFSRVEKLKSPGFDPKWKDMDLKKGVPGIGRFRAPKTGSIAPILSNRARFRDESAMDRDLALPREHFVLAQSTSRTVVGLDACFKLVRARKRTARLPPATRRSVRSAFRTHARCNSGALNSLDRSPLRQLIGRRRPPKPGSPDKPAESLPFVHRGISGKSGRRRPADRARQVGQSRRGSFG